MRIVIFTENPAIEASPWWPVVCGTPGLERLLVVRRYRSSRPADVLRRLRRNVRKHGLIFLPYRLAVLAASLARRVLASRVSPPRPAAPAGVPVDRVEALDVHQSEVLEQVRGWGPDLGLSLGAPILRRSLFGIPRRGTINLHSGKVPDYRGAPPAFWELVTGATEIGAAVHWMDDGLDTGAVIASAAAPIYPQDTLADVEARAEELGLMVLREALGRLAAGEAGGTPQPPGGATYRFPTLSARLRLWARLTARRARRRWLRPAHLIKAMAGATCLLLVRPLRDLARTLRRRHPVRVFTFHRVSDLCRDGMTVSRRLFERQLGYIARHHEVVPLARAVELAAAGARLRRPVAAITFDDGYRSVFTEARPAMAARGLVGCCFVCTDLVGTDRRYAHDEANPARQHLEVMGWEELAALVAASWDVGGHTASHPRLASLGGEELRREVASPIAALRQRLGLAVVPMAYPFGGRDDITPEAARLVRESGYSACFSDFGGENRPAAGAYDLLRIDVGGDHDAIGWKTMVHGIMLSRWRALGRGG